MLAGKGHYKPGQRAVFPLFKILCRGKYTGSVIKISFARLYQFAKSKCAWSLARSHICSLRETIQRQTGSTRRRNVFPKKSREGKHGVKSRHRQRLLGKELYLVLGEFLSDNKFQELSLRRSGIKGIRSFQSTIIIKRQNKAYF